MYDHNCQKFEWSNNWPENCRFFKDLEIIETSSSIDSDCFSNCFQTKPKVVWFWNMKKHQNLWFFENKIQVATQHW